MSETATIHRDQATIDFLVYWGLTPKQAEMYLFLFEAIRRDGTQFSAKEIGEAFGISENGAKGYLKRIALKGWISRPTGGHSGVTIKRGPDGAPFRGFTYERAG